MAQPIASTRTDNRPRRRGAAALLAVVLAAAAMVQASPVQATGGDGLRAAANTYRMQEWPQEGPLNPVGASALLDDIAVRRAAQMVNADKLEHDIDYVFDRLNSSGVCWKGFGEIIAWERGYPEYSYERTMGMWWDSPTHHAVMMGDDYNAAGGAWKSGDDGAHYSVMIFAELCSSSIAYTSTPLLKPVRKYNPDRPMVFRHGTFTGYRLSESGDVIGRKSVTFERGSRTTSAGRTPTDGRAWLKVSGGPLAGYWVRESEKSYVRGVSARTDFSPAEQLRLVPGRYTGLKFDWLGGIEREKAFRTSWTAKMRTSARAMISGHKYFLVSSGALDGWWLRDTDAVTLR
jgi:uncharacterized protein YkwD